MILPPGLSEADHKNAQWVWELMEEMRAIVPGLTRGDLLRVFEPQGGLSHPKQQSFFCRRCRYFLVHAEFDLFDESAPARLPYDERDRVKTISAVYLGVAAMD